MVALDNLTTGRLSNLDEASKSPGFHFVQGSVLDELVIDELVHQCDVVDPHGRGGGRAARGGAAAEVADHQHPRVAGRDRRRAPLPPQDPGHQHVARSTGRTPLGPLHETADRILGSPSIVRWAYSTAKAVDEILANCYHRERGLPTIVVRLFNTVGARQSPAYGMVIPRLVRQALRDEPLTVFGDGRQTRCFAHVLDVVDALLRLLDDEAAVGQTFNIGSSEEISIGRLAETIIARCQSRSRIELIPYDQAYGAGFEDMQRRVPDTTKLRALTGWAPRYTLADVLADAIAEARLEAAPRPDLVSP